MASNIRWKSSFENERFKLFNVAINKHERTKLAHLTTKLPSMRNFECYHDIIESTPGIFETLKQGNDFLIRSYGCSLLIQTTDIIVYTT